MKKILFILCLTVGNSLFANSDLICADTNENEVKTPPMSSLEDFFTSANTFFNKYVASGNVKYTEVKSEATSIQKLVEMIAAADLSAANQNTKIAFYINAYNLLVIKSVIDKMPIKKPTDVPGFFDTKKHSVAGVYLTLNEIENKKLRPDPRVHFVLVCAAKGCPKLINEAYMPEKVQLQLDTQTKNALNDANFIKINDTNKTVSISKIFDWYKDDFIADAGSAINYINKIRSISIPAAYTLNFYEYDWNLNGN